MEAETRALAMLERMWTEALFRDLRNRDWGLGLDRVRLSTADRHDRHFAILALAYLLLCVFGAAAETIDILLKTGEHGGDGDGRHLSQRSVLRPTNGGAACRTPR